jgi:hypothetical protein
LLGDSRCRRLLYRATSRRRIFQFWRHHHSKVVFVYTDAVYILISHIGSGH